MSTKCDNCYNTPDYVLDDFGARAQYFCKSHFPSIYKDRLKHGMITVWVNPETVAETVAVELDILEPVIKKVSKKNTKKALIEEAQDEQNPANPDETGSSSSDESDADTGSLS